MRVLHVDSAREWRGGQTQLLHLARAQGPDAVVALPPDALLRPALEAAGVEVVPIPLRAWGRGVGSLRRIAARQEISLVAAHTSHAHQLSVLAGVRPLVVHRRLDFAPGRGWTTRAKYRAPAGYVAVSEGVARVLRGAGVSPERIAVVRDGVLAGDFEPVSQAVARARLGVAPEVPVIAAVGALVAHKGHRVLIDAVGILARRGFVVHVLLAGDGPLREVLARRIARRGLEGRIRLLGWRRDVASVWSAADVACHPSTEEGLGQAVIEAQVCGRSVVASAVGGLPELVQSGVNGWLVAPGDAECLADALHWALSNPLVAQRCGRRARELALARHGVEGMVDGTLQAYDRWVARDGGA